MASPPSNVSPTSAAASTAVGGGVRRHHTISSSSRATRVGTRESVATPDIEESQAWQDEDELVGQDWPGGVGAVGEKTSLHRQSSLPTRYHRVFHGRASKTGHMTPTRMNSLTAIAGHDVDEEDWELQQEIGAYSVHEESQEAVESPPVSPQYGNMPHVPSPPPSDAGVRRHVSLTYGAARNKQQFKTGLRRAGTLQTPLPPHPPVSLGSSPPKQSQEVDEDDYGYSEEPTNLYEEEYVGKQSGYVPTSPIRTSAWGENDWRNIGSTSTGTSIDDVQRALSSLELSNTNNIGLYQSQAANIYQPTTQNNFPPRLNPGLNQSPPPILRGTNDFGNGSHSRKSTQEFEDRKTPVSQASSGSGSAVGSSYLYQQQQQRDERSQSSRRSLTPRTSNTNLQYGFQQGRNNGNGIPSVPPIPAQYLQQSPTGQSQSRLALNTNSTALAPSTDAAVTGLPNTAIDVPTLMATKGYNPVNFDIRPHYARYFVIKSYTEDDVHKSLKYEIWSSTDPGNKRLDKAFREINGRGPLYLFFSVNASGHFCGMAEMLTPVDYTRSSTVWASDKWKGVFKVRWIFVRDIPNVNLRHIKLNNTSERKPVTNSRDTQELLSEAGLEMLRIFHTHPARTTLLQDFAFYELQSMQKAQGQSQSGTMSPVNTPPSNPLNSPLNSPPMQSLSPVHTGSSNLAQQQGQTNMFAMQSANALAAYQQMQMSPMLQMQMMQMQMNNSGLGMGLGGMGAQFGMTPQSQAMHQSVMRHPSPAPPSGNQGFMGMPGF